MTNELSGAKVTGVIPNAWNRAFAAGKASSDIEALERKLGVRFEQWGDDFSGAVEAMPVSKLKVAASDSDSNYKAAADFICTGTADNRTIQSAVDALAGPGAIEIGPGNYYFADGGDETEEVVLVSGQHVYGHGMATVIHQPAGQNGANRAFRIQGTNLLSGAITDVTLRDMRINHPGQSSPIRVLRARNCRIQNIYGEGPDGSALGSPPKSMMVSIQLAELCDFINITGVATGAGGHGQWNTIHGIQIYDCRFVNITGIKTRSAVDFWGARGCVVDRVTAIECDEGLDIGQSSFCNFTNLYLIDNERAGVTLKEESGTPTTGEIPARWLPYEYGSKRNLFDGFLIDGYSANGIGMASDGSSANAQPLDFNTIKNGSIFNSTPKLSGIVFHTAIKIGKAAGGAGQTHNLGTVIDNVRIEVSEGDGIRYNHMRGGKFNNLRITVDGGVCASTVEGASSTNYGSGNQWSNCRFEQLSETVSTSNICVSWQLESGLQVTNCEFVGGFVGLAVTDCDCSAFTNLLSKDVQGQSYWVRLAAAVDRTDSNGNVGLSFSQCNSQNSNLSNSSRKSWRFEVDGNIAATVRNVTLVACGILDTQGTPTSADMEFITLNGGAYEYMRRIGNWVYTNATPTIPAGTGNAIS